MKKLFFPLLALIIMAGCNDDKDAVQPGNNGKQEIHLTAGISRMQIADKAAVDGEAFANDTEIGLYAIEKPITGNVWEGTAEYSNDGTVTITNDNINIVDKNSAPKKFYFPANDQKIAFYSWYPKGTLGTVTPKTAPTITFDLAAADQPDIMYASAESEPLSTYITKTVALKFQHKLAKIGFKVKAGSTFLSTGVSVSKVTIAGLNTSATLTLGTDALSFAAGSTTEIVHNITDVAIGTSESGVIGTTLLEPGATYSLTVTAGNIDYTLNNLKSPQAGQAQNIVLTFDGTAMDATASITRWEELGDDNQNISK